MNENHSSGRFTQASRDDMLADLQAFQNQPHLAPTVVRANVTVTNGGTRPGEWSVLLFARPPPAVAGIDGAPLQTLLDFQRTTMLHPGQHQTLTFEVSAHDLSHGNAEGKREIAPGSWEIFAADEDGTPVDAGAAAAPAGGFVVLREARNVP